MRQRLGLAQAIAGSPRILIVAVTAGGESPFELRVPSKPARLVVDPDVELLFAGRRRTETALAAP